MDDRREKPEPSRRGPLLAFAAIILIAYPLSIGPIMWLQGYGYIADDNVFIYAIYQPLFLLRHVVPGFGDVLFRYIDLWVPILP